jgi:hypothetical protein
VSLQLLVTSKRGNGKHSDTYQPLNLSDCKGAAVSLSG